jgi:hypothetical protein
MRRALILAGVGLFALILLINVLNMLTKASISVNTDDPDGYVKVERLAQSGQKGKSFSKQRLSHLTVRVSPGTYQLTASGPGGNFATSTSKVVQVKAREKVSYTLNPAVVRDPEPVYGNIAQDLRADDSSLGFLDTQNSQSGSLLEVTSNGDVTHLFPDHTDLASIRWITSQRAVAQDSGGNLYLIDGGSISSLRLPFDSGSGSSRALYDVGSNGSIYVSNGQNVYLSVDGNGYRKIFTTNDRIRSLSAGANEVAVVTNGEADKLTVVSDSGHERTITIDVEQVSWAPDYKHLLIRQDTADVVIDSLLQNENSFLINGSDNLVWKDRDNLYYSVDSQIWQLKLSTKDSVKLGSLSSGQSITRIYPDTSGSYVYFQSNNGEKQQLYRISLGRKPVSSAVNQLDTYLPLSLDECYVSYLNYGITRILLTPFNDSQTNDCLSTIKTRLTRYGLNTSRYVFDILPATSSSVD